MIAVTYIRGDLQYELWELMPTRKAFSSDEAYNEKEVELLVSIVLNGTMVIAAVIMVIGAIGFITGFTLNTCLLMTVSVRNRTFCSPESTKAWERKHLN